MVTFDGNSHLDFAFQKALHYNHYRKNYKMSLQNGVIQPGLCIKKQPAFIPTKIFLYQIRINTLLHRKKISRTLISQIRKSSFKNRNQYQQSVH